MAGLGVDWELSAVFGLDEAKYFAAEVSTPLTSVGADAFFRGVVLVGFTVLYDLSGTGKDV